MDRVKEYAAQFTSVDVDQAERRLDAELDQPEGDILAGLGFALLVALLAIGVGIATGAWYALLDDANDAVLTSRLVLEAQERLRLSHPLCTATMTTSVAGVVDQRGCYIPKARR